MADKKNDGGPAFPCINANRGRSDGANIEGMSLRDYFAGQVVNGICHGLVHGIRPADIVNLTRDAYGIADAMLAERGKP